MENDKAWTYLRFAARAGKAPSGEFQTENAIKSRKARVVVLAEDASENTKKHFSDMCRNAGVPFVMMGDRQTLGHAIGKEFRSSCAITDVNLAKAFLEESEGRQ